MSTVAGLPTRDIAPSSQHHYNRLAGRGLERLCALSDGLFAIAMTLIVLEVRVPTHGEIHTDTALLYALGALLPRLTTYFLSFVTLGIFWVGQQTQLNQFKSTDRHLTWLHLLFLSLIAFLPFSTGLLAEFTEFRVALLLYWLNIFLLGVVIYASWSYAERHGLVKEDAPPETGRAIRRRIISAQALYLFGAALCLFHTSWSIAFIVIVQLNYVFAPRIPLLSKLTN